MKKLFLTAVLTAAVAGGALAQSASLTAHASAVQGGQQIAWQEPQPQPYYYLIFRSPSGPDFPKRVNPNFNGIADAWTDVSAKPNVNYRYRVCGVYSPDGSARTCTDWFSS